MTATTTATSSSQQPEQPNEKWTVRYTWRVPEGSTHPQQTESQHASEGTAVDAAVRVLDSQHVDATLKLIRAEVRGPGRDWRAVEWTP